MRTLTPLSPIHRAQRLVQLAQRLGLSAPQPPLGAEAELSALRAGAGEQGPPLAAALRRERYRQSLRLSGRRCFSGAGPLPYAPALSERRASLAARRRRALAGALSERQLRAELRRQRAQLERAQATRGEAP